MKRDTERMYATMVPWRLFFVVALPGMISMFAMSVYSVIEGVFIGQRLGESAFAAVNIALPLVFINFSLADLIGVGASVPISIALGKKDHDTANNVFSCSVIMIFIASSVMGALTFAFSEPLCRMMGANGELLETAVRYLRTCALLSPISSIFFAMDNYLRISGYVKTSMIINVCSNLLTLGLLSFFLLVLNMDVVGSSLAVSTSLSICAIIAMVPFIRKKTLLRFKKPEFSKEMIKQIGACGSPIFLSNVSGRITAIFINMSLVTLGIKAFGEGGETTAVAVYAVLMYASDLCWPLLYGISDSLAPAIGYNWGAENYGRVKAIFKCAFVGTALIGIISTSLLFFFPNFVAQLFVNSEDVMLLGESTRAIRLFSFAYLFRWFAVITQGFFSAIEKPKVATIMSVSTAFIFPLIILVSLWGLGLDGVWFNFVGVNFLSSVLGVILIFRLNRTMLKSNRAKENS